MVAVFLTLNAPLFTAVTVRVSPAVREVTVMSGVLSFVTVSLLEPELLSAASVGVPGVAGAAGGDRSGVLGILGVLGAEVSKV